MRNKAFEDRMVARAQQWERENRRGEISNLLAQGHIKVVEDCSASHISMRCGTVTFTDIREEFPTTRMMADIALARVGGETCLNDPKEDRFSHQRDAYRDGKPRTKGLRP